jgi:hypothetical protein
MPKESRKPLAELTLEERLYTAEGVNHPKIKEEISSDPFPPRLPLDQYDQLRRRVIQLESWQNIAEEELRGFTRSRAIKQYIRKQHQSIGGFLRKHHKSRIREDVELWGYLDEGSRISLAYPVVKGVIKMLGYDKYYTTASQTHNDRLIAKKLSSEAYGKLKGEESISRIIIHDAFRTSITGFHGRKRFRPRNPKEAANLITLANLELAWLRSRPGSPEADLAIKAMCVLKTRYLDDMTRNSRVEVAYGCDWYMDEFLSPEERTRVVSHWRKCRQKRKEEERLKKEAAQRAEEKRKAELREHFEKFGGPAGERKSRRPTPKGGSVRTVQGGAPGLGKRKS